MKSSIRWFLKVGAPLALLLVATALAGCFFEMVSWSPDGRYVVFASNELLWRWDGQTGRTEQLPLRLAGAAGEMKEAKSEEKKEEPKTVLLEDEVFCCRCMPDGNEILVWAGKEEEGSLYLLNLKNMLCERIDRAIDPYFDVSRDGKRIYYTRSYEGTQQTILYCYERGKEARSLLISKDGIGFPRESPDGKRVLYLYAESKKNALCVLDLASGTTDTLVRAGGPDFENGMFWPAWLNDRTVLYLQMDEKEKDYPVGDLQVYSLDDRTTRSLCRDIHFVCPPSLSKDGRFVFATKGIRDSEGKMDDDKPATWQAVSVNTASGETKQLTNAPFGAMWPTVSPDGQRLAYLTYPTEDDDYSLLAILDLKTGRSTLTWRNDEERLFAEAERLLQENKKAEARKAYQKLIDDYYSSDLAEVAEERIKLVGE